MRYLLSVLPVALALGGCADLNKSLTEANNSLLASRTMAAPTQSTTEARIEVPNDPKVSQAFDQALPRIKKVIGIHKCINHPDGMLQLNSEAVPGVNMASNNAFPNNRFAVKYHDRSKCFSVRAIDRVSMPANNALTFRVVYFADDSGETLSYAFLFKKMDNGAWLLGAPIDMVH